MVRTAAGPVSLSLVSILVAGCPGESRTPAVAHPAPDGSACTVEGWLDDVVEVGRRAARGETVVAADGCSLFDGALLARGYPASREEARPSLTVDGACVPVLAVSGSHLWLQRRDGQVVVTRARMVDGAEQEPPEVKDWETGLVRAARCPLPERRLRTERDAGAALSFALAMAELRQALEAAGAGGAGPDAQTRAALDHLCKSVPAPALVTEEGRAREGARTALPVRPGQAADLDPLAANAVVMAGSFTILGQAAGQLEVGDPGLKAVRPAALGVLAHPPRTNLEGACALHFMAGAAWPAKAPVRQKKRR